MIDICSLFLPSEDDVVALFPGRDLKSVAADFFAAAPTTSSSRRATRAAKA